MPLSVDQRVRIVGFESYPKNGYNNLLARIEAYNTSSGRLVARLECDDGLVLLSERHVSSDIATSNELNSSKSTHTTHIHRTDTCAICLSELACTPRVQTRCTHVFHTSCLERWKQTKRGATSCPICRRTINDVALKIQLRSNVYSYL